MDENESQRPRQLKLRGSKRSRPDVDLPNNNIERKVDKKLRTVTVKSRDSKLHVPEKVLEDTKITVDSDASLPASILDNTHLQAGKLSDHNSELEHESQNYSEGESEDAENLKGIRPLMGGKFKADFISADERAVILLNRLPHGFAENQLRTFFSQFGDITRLRLVRSKKTGNSKGYAFIEFALKEVAEIVASTMNGYIMFGVTIKCRVLPREGVPKGVFTKYVKYPRRGWTVDKQRLHHNKAEGSFSELHLTRILDKEAKRNEKLKSLGIDFTPPTILKKKKKNC